MLTFMLLIHHRPYLWEHSLSWNDLHTLEYVDQEAPDKSCFLSKNPSLNDEEGHMVEIYIELAHMPELQAAIYGEPVTNAAWRFNVRQ